MATINPFLKSPFQELIDRQEPQPMPGSDPVVNVEMPQIEAAPAAQAAPQPEPQTFAPKAGKKASLAPPPELRPLFAATAEHFGVPENVLMAIAQQESSYNANAVNKETGASGMAQYMGATAKALGINATDPNEAIPATAMQIRERMDKGMSLEDAIKEHFAGPNRKLWGNKTTAYGREVLAKAEQIGAELYGDAPQQAEPEKQNAFAADRMARAEYEANFKALNPKATPDALAAVMAQYDQQAAARTKAKGNAVQDRFASLKSPEAMFDERLNAKLQAKNQGVAQAAPERQQPVDVNSVPRERPGIIEQAQGDFGRGIENLKALGYGVGGLVADQFGNDEAATRMLDEYVAIQNDIAKSNPATIGTYKNIKSMGDAGRYAVEAVAENLPMLIPSLVTGGIGAQIGKKGAERVVAGMIETQVAKGVAREVAEKQAAQFVAKRIMLGSIAGAAPASVGMESGSIMGDIYQETGEKRSGIALAGGIPAGLLDTIQPVMALRKIAGPVVDEVAGGIVKRMGREAGLQFLAEAGTEGLQTVIEEFAAAKAANRDMSTDHIIDAMLKGGIGGGVMGVASQGVAEARSALAQPGMGATPNPQPQNRVEPTMEAPAAPSGPLTAALSNAANVQADEEGFTAQVMGDDGQMYTLDTRTGVTAPAEPAAQTGPLEAAISEAAEQHAADPAPAPIQPEAEPAAPDYTAMALPDLQARLKEIAAQAKESTQARQQLMPERKQIEQAVNAKLKEAKEASKPAEEPLAAGPFEDIKAANRMMLRFVESTGAPHEVVGEAGQYRIQLLEVNDGTERIDPAGAGGRDDGPGRSGEPAVAARSGDGIRPEGTGPAPVRAGNDAGQRVRDVQPDSPAATDAANADQALSEDTRPKVNPYANRRFAAPEKGEVFIDKEGIDRNQFEVVQTGPARWQVLPRLPKSNAAEVKTNVPERQEVPEEAPVARGEESTQQGAAAGSEAAGAGKAAAPAAPELSSIQREMESPSSWIVRNKETGEVITELRGKSAVDKINKEKYEAVPALQHLQELNDPESKAYKAARPTEAPAAPAAEAKPKRQPSRRELTNARQEEVVRKAAESLAARKAAKESTEPQQAAAEQPPAPTAAPAYRLPEDVGTDWRRAEALDFEPDARQKIVMDAVEKAIADGVFYNRDMDEKVAEALGVDADVRSRKNSGTEGGDFGYDVYMARKAVEAKQRYAEIARVQAEQNFKVGDVLGTLIFNDFKVNTGVTVKAVNGDQIKLRGKRGAYSVTMETGPTNIKYAIERAHEKGKRKDSYEEFIASRSEAAPAKPKRKPAAKKAAPEQAEEAEGVRYSISGDDRAPSAELRASVLTQWGKIAEPVEGFTFLAARNKKNNRGIFIIDGKFDRDSFKKVVGEATAAGLDTKKFYIVADTAPYTSAAIDLQKFADFAEGSITGRKDQQGVRYSVSGDVTQEQADAYMAALESGNKREALRILHEAVGIEDVDASFDRGGAHTPSGPEDGSPLYDVSRAGTYPEDIYGPKGLMYYGTGEDAMDREAYALIKQFEAHPNMTVTVYRAVESGGAKKILPGDWVTTVRQYAKDHGEGHISGDYKIISARVYARDIFTSGDSWLEWGYHPQEFKPEISKGANKMLPLQQKVANWKARSAAQDGQFSVANIPMVADALPVVSPFIQALADAGAIELHADASTLPVKGRVPQGVQALTTADGRIHVVADSLNGNARGIVLHEAFHAGSKSLVGSAAWQDLMQRLGSLYRQGEKSGGAARTFWDKARARVATAKAKGAVADGMEHEEFGAYAIEEYEAAPLTVRKWVDDLLGAVKAWALRRFGRQLGQVTPAQLSALAKVALLDVAASRAQPAYSVDDRRTEDRGTEDRRHTVQFEGKRRPIENSRGTLIAEDMNKQLAFYRWFKDSQVVDEQQRPLVVYHGTPKDFSEFKPGRHGLIFTSPDADFAATYAGGEWTIEVDGGSPNVIPVYVSAKNIFDGDKQEHVDAVMRRLEKDGNPDAIEADRFAGKYWELLEEDSIIQAIRKAGFDGLYVMESKKLNIAVFEPSQLKSAVGNNGQFDPANADIRYSVAGDPQPRELTPPEQGLLRRVQAQIQDSQNRIKQVQERIKQAFGVESLGNADHYLAETNRPGRIAARKEDARDRLLEPMIRRLADAGYELAQLDELLHAQHAKERNAAVAQINPAFPDGGSGMTNAQADAVLARYENEGALLRLADEARNIARETLALKKAYGLLTDEQFDSLAVSYDNYVPLKGDGEYGPKVKRAMGHGERDEHILENIARDYEQAVVVGEKNLARQSLVQMVLQFADDALWTARVPPRGRYVAGTVFNVKHKGTQEVEASYTSQSQVAAFLEAKGAEAAQYEVNTSGGEQVVEFTKPLQDNEVMVYIKGSPVRVQVYDETLARQLRPLRSEQMNAVLEAMRKHNRWLSMVFTGYNPSFIIKNATRDAITGTINMTGNNGAVTAAKAWARYPMAWATMLQWAATKKVPDTTMGQYLTEYRSQGGKVGASYMSDLEEQGKSLQRMFDDAKGVTGYAAEGRVLKASAVAARKAIGGLAHAVEIVNQAFENALRLALFAQLRAEGKKPGVAAAAAKAVTVNFDRKGAMTPQLGAFYLFINPAIQGTANLTNTLVKGEHKYQAWALTGMMAAAGFAAAVHGMDDDKDRWLGEKWDTRTKNLRIRIGETTINIPLSQEYAPFYAMGVAMGEVSRGESSLRATVNTLSSFLDAYYPMQGAAQPDSDNPGLDLLLAHIPTVGKVPAQIATNRSSFGGKVIPEAETTKNRPDNLKMNRGTKGSVYDAAAQTLATGKPYENDLSKVSPETLKLLWTTYTGGLGRFVADTIGAGNLARQADLEMDASDVPIVKDFVKPDNVNAIRSRFYDLSAEARKTIDEFAAAKKALDRDAMREIAQRPEARVHLGLAKMVKSVNEVQALYADQAVTINADTKLTDAEKRERLNALEAEQEAIYRKAIEAFTR